MRFKDLSRSPSSFIGYGIWADGFQGTITRVRENNDNIVLDVSWGNGHPLWHPHRVIISLRATSTQVFLGGKVVMVRIPTIEQPCYLIADGHALWVRSSEKDHELARFCTNCRHIIHESAGHLPLCCPGCNLQMGIEEFRTPELASEK